MTITFPLKLSCGHTADQVCSCTHIKHYDNNGDSPIDIALRDYQGRWREILENYGARLPAGRHHGPCPICGGKDRFRFDDKDGLGTWFCNQCGSAGGLKLLSLYIGKSTIDTAKELVGDKPKSIAPKRQFKPRDDSAIRKMNHEQAKKGAQSLLDSAVVATHPYMDKKGLTGEWLVNGEPIMGREAVIDIGQLLLVPAYRDGELINMQKIKTDGEKRPITGGDMEGVYHKIDGKVKMIAIVEGFATGVTVNKMTGATTYCAFNTGNLTEVGKFVKSQHPKSKIVFFADRDEHKAGQKYADNAAVPIGGIVALSPELGDWDDYRQKHGEEQCKQAMRNAIRKDKGQPVLSKKPKKGLPEGISLDGYEIDEPPGLAGEIVGYIKDGASRLLTGGAYAMAAIQCMGMAGAGLQGYKGVKLSLVTLTLGMSAAGKERPQKVIKELLDANGRNVYGDIRSDKDVIRSAIYDNGNCFYVVDEAQKILCSGSSQNKHMTNVVSTLMELSTTSCYKLSQLHRDEFVTQLENSKQRFEKMMTAKEDDLKECNPDLDEGKMKAIELDIERFRKKVEAFEQRIHVANTGVINPALHLQAYSTPQKLASIVDEDSIESGFLGRALIGDCGVERSEILTDFDEEEEHREIDPKLEYLKAQIGLICQLSDDVTHLEFNGGEFKYVPTPDALQDFKSIAWHYDQYHYRNHGRAGAIYARLLERVLSISSIMALGNIDKRGHAIIERDYVRYALLLTLGSIKHLMSNLKVNEGSTGNTMEEKIDAVKEAIIKRLTVDRRDSDKGWRYKTEIKNYLKRRKFYQKIQEECLKVEQDAFENALVSLGQKIEKTPDNLKIRLSIGR